MIVTNRPPRGQPNFSEVQAQQGDTLRNGQEGLYGAQVVQDTALIEIREELDRSAATHSYLVNGLQDQVNKQNVQYQGMRNLLEMNTYETQTQLTQIKVQQAQQGDALSALQEELARTQVLCAQQSQQIMQKDQVIAQLEERLFEVEAKVQLLLSKDSVLKVV